MIVTVTCNPAVDVTYRVDSLAPGEVHRVDTVVERPGGKGVNVSRVLHQLGVESIATGFADTWFGATVEALGVRAAFVPALPKVRRTLVVHGDEATTSFWEPGLPAAHEAEDALEEMVTGLLVRASALVVSGSLPSGADPRLPVRLAGLATSARVPVVLDVDGAALRAAADGGGAVLVPNLDELAGLVGGDARSDVVVAARELSALSGAPVVVTLGADGMLAVDGAECWRAEVPERVAGNPTGAGDAATAAIARGLGDDAGWPQIVADATALSAAAVVAPVAGEVDLASYERWRHLVEVRAVQPATAGE